MPKLEGKRMTMFIAPKKVKYITYISEVKLGAGENKCLK